MRPDSNTTASHITISSVVLVAFNLVPLIGVLVWGWSVVDVLMLYWAENVVIGLFNIPRMLSAGGFSGEGQWGWQLFGRMFPVAFFIVHYGLFCLIHGTFVLELFGDDGAYIGGTIGPTEGGLFNSLMEFSWAAGLGLALLGLAVSHGVSFVVNWIGRGEYRTATTSDRMTAVYGRIMVLHVALLLGGFAVAALGQPVTVIALLVVFKTIGDLAAHRREHARLAERVEGEDVMGAG